MKNILYDDMLRDAIMEFVRISSYRTLEDMTDRARERVIWLRLRLKQKPAHDRATKGPTKRPKNSDSQSIGRQVWAIVESAINRTIGSVD